MQGVRIDGGSLKMKWAFIQLDIIDTTENKQLHRVDTYIVSRRTIGLRKKRRRVNDRGKMK